MRCCLEGLVAHDLPRERLRERKLGTKRALEMVSRRSWMSRV